MAEPPVPPPSSAEPLPPPPSLLVDPASPPTDPICPPTENGADPVADGARRLRTVEQLPVREIQARLGISRNRAYALLRGVPAPVWTRRPTARDDLRAEAVRLRADGRSVNDIAERLGVAKSTAYQWVRHLPLDGSSEEARQRRQAHSKAMTEARWERHRWERDAAQAETHVRAAGEVGVLDDRDLLLLGAAIYWCEGTKSKPWRRDDRLQLINSDIRVLRLFLRFLASCGIDREVPSYRLSIHESADVDAAVAWWVRALDLPEGRFRRATLKRHQPRAGRYNKGDDYHGCLIIDVPRSRELYWRIEGVVAALASDGV